MAGKARTRSTARTGASRSKTTTRARTPPASRKTTASTRKTTASTRTAPARKPASRTTRTRSTPRTGPSAGATAMRGVGTAFGAMAKGVGAGARAIGRTRELEHAHRRDGLALCLIAVGVVLAAGVWLQAGGPVGSAVDTGVRTIMGAGAWLAPLLLLAAAITLMRTEPEPEARPRLVTGWLLLIVAVLGVWHVIGGLPETMDERRRAGGAVGFAAGGPLSAGVTEWLAVPLLVLVALFGLLVLTGTTAREVPHRLRRLLGADRFDDELGAEDELVGAESDGADLPGHGWPTDDELAAQPTEKLRRPSRRRQAAASTDAADTPAGVRGSGDQDELPWDAPVEPVAPKRPSPGHSSPQAKTRR